MACEVPTGRPSADELAPLRGAAALLSCVPSASARLRHFGRTVLEVRRPPHPTVDHAVLPPCWFRGLVADALAGDLGADDTERVVGLARCRIDIGVRDGTSVLSGGVVPTYGGTAWLHLLPVAAPHRLVAPVAEAAFERSDISHVHADDDLDATVLALASDRSAAGSEASADVLRTIAVRVAVERLERDLAARDAHPSRSRRTATDPARNH